MYTWMICGVCFDVVFGPRGGVTWSKGSIAVQYEGKDTDGSFCNLSIRNRRLTWHCCHRLPHLPQPCWDIQEDIWWRKGLSDSQSDLWMHSRSRRLGGVGAKWAVGFIFAQQCVGELSAGNDRKVLPVEWIGSLNIIYSPCITSFYCHQHVCLQGRIRVLGMTFKCVIAIHFTHRTLHIYLVVSTGFLHLVSQGMPVKTTVQTELISRKNNERQTEGFFVTLNISQNHLAIIY